MLQRPALKSESAATYIGFNENIDIPIEHRGRYVDI